MDDPADGPRDDHDPTGQDTPTSDRRGAEEPFRVEESLLASEATGHPRRELDERLHGEPPGSHESQSGRHGEREGGRGEHGDHHGRPGERGAGQHAHGDGHGGMHEGDEELFRRRFFVSTLLSIPVILYSETIQGWAGFTMPAFPGSESRTQVLADRAAGWLFYVALAAAAVTAVAWSVATAFDAGVVERAVTVLVIACPHALGLAVPLVVAIDTSLAARNGMLVRDRIAMERARELDVVVFDKTGTLTTGEHGVVDLATVESVGEDEALALAAAVEGDSEHVIARAIREAADERGVEVPSVSDFEALEGPRRSRLRCWLTAASRAGGLTTPTLGRESLRPEGRKSTRTFITGDGTGECMDRGARLTRQIAADESPSVAVAEAVAEYLDQDSTDLRPLFEVVDGDALDAVLQAPDAEVTFEYQGAEVRVVGTSTVEVR